MSKQAKVTVILHLCLVFTMLSWYGGYPFMGELYEVKSEKALFDNVISSDLYSGLDPIEKNELEQHYKMLNEKLQRGFWPKFSDTFRILVFGLPSFLQAWLLLSVAIATLLLRNKEGAAEVCFVLPVLIALLTYQGVYHAKTPNIRADYKLFPSEEYLVKTYLSGELSGSIMDQHSLLKGAWEEYLLNEWSDGSGMLIQAEEKFNYARSIALKDNDQNGYSFTEKRSGLFYLSLFCWSLFLAWISRGKDWRLHSRPIDTKNIGIL